MPVDVGSPFGSPISLVSLTFSNPNGSLKSLLPGHAAPGAIDDREPDIQPRRLRGQPPGDTSTQHRPVQARVQVSLPATAAPADRCESITGSGTWPGSPSSRPVMPQV